MEKASFLRSFDLAKRLDIDVGTLKSIQGLIQNHVQCNGLLLEDISTQVILYLKYCKGLTDETLTVQDLKRAIVIIEEVK